LESPQNESRRIAFVSTRLAGLDGVSLEAKKWSTLLETMGHQCVYVAGECERLAGDSRLIPELHFKHPTISSINEQCFGRVLRTREVASQIHEMKWIIGQKLQSTVEDFNADLIIAENCLTIPLNIPLGLALVELVMETGVGCIAHHHDFVWERERFDVNAVDDYLMAAFPPPLLQMQHVVINSKAARDFSRRTGLPCRVVPNVMDFDNPPPPPDDYARSFRAAIGVGTEDLMFLQPTRLVARKGIEHAIELIHSLDGRRCKLVISHASGDEGDTYAERIRRYANAMNVDIVFADAFVSTRRRTSPAGHRLYTIGDAYSCADFVTYPSTYEGFGNAFLEAIYYRKPILCNRYGIYRTDIQPCGFDVVLMDGFLTDDVVSRVRRVLDDPDERQRMVDQNYEIGARFFSYRRAADELHALLAKPRLSASMDTPIAPGPSGFSSVPR
jgi:glycosyltransferase involved in cell wall biosynthesis